MKKESFIDVVTNKMEKVFRISQNDPDDHGTWIAAAHGSVLAVQAQPQPVRAHEIGYSLENKIK